MAKRTPGLPSTFKINTTKEDLAGPAQGGSFLEETFAKPPAPVQVEPEPGPAAIAMEPEPTVEEKPQAPKRQPADVVELRRDKPEVRQAPRRAGPDESDLEDEGDEERAPVRRPSPPRKQINLKPDAILMAERLLQQIQRDSGQKDAKGSEMFTALLLALEEAASHLDLSAMQPRGAWGSRTARAFPVALKKHFIQAIGQLYEESYRGKR